MRPIVRTKKYLRIIVTALVILAVRATMTQASRIIWSETPIDTVRPSTTSDPVADAVRRETLSRAPDLKQKPAPFLKLEIPDPLETQKLLGCVNSPSIPIRPSPRPARRRAQFFQSSHRPNQRSDWERRPPGRPIYQSPSPWTIPASQEAGAPSHLIPNAHRSTTPNTSATIK